MKFSVFYSWQSDLPNNSNRGFIETVLAKTIKDMSASDHYDVVPSIDRDTLGVPGAPNISETILEKIRGCDAFVADISIVTGDKEQGQRPSPNPNVLIELGYAISELGWGRIILFCNTLYGSDADLPFDIRQHRRISYELAQRDPKEVERKKLSKMLRSRLEEILDEGKRNLRVSGPLLAASWNFIDHTKDLQSGGFVDHLELYRAEPIPAVFPQHQAESLMERTITGSFDPNWGEKIEAYKKEIAEFEKEVEDDQKRLNYLIMSNLPKLVTATVVVENNGNAAATDIRASFDTPEWLHVFNDLPDESETPQVPKPPKPSLPTPIERVRSLSELGEIHGFEERLGSLISPNIHRTSGCRVYDGEIRFWDDRLLHKHRSFDSDDRFYLLAMADAPKGEHVLPGSIFCSEFEDWRDSELVIRIM
jgi:hypothetical protein